MSLNSVIGSSPLFKGLNQAQLETVANLATVKSIPQGTILFKEMDALESLYLLEEGSIRLTMGVRLWSGTAILRSIVHMVTPGEAFGWSALIEPYIATLSSESEEESSVVAIDAAGLRDMLDGDRDAGYHVMRGLAHLVGNRLRHIQETWMGAKASDLQRMPIAAGLFTHAPRDERHPAASYTRAAQ